VRALDGEPVSWANSSTNQQKLLVKQECSYSHYRVVQLRTVIAGVNSRKRKSKEEALQCTDDSACAAAVAAVTCCPACHCPASIHQADVCSMLIEEFSDRVLCFEVNLLKKSVDIFMPLGAAGVAIEVDGSQHGEKDMHGTTASQQEAQDDAYNKKVLEGDGTTVKGLVRLHWADGPKQWQATVARALQLARDVHVRSFVVFSRVYREGTEKCKQDEVHMH
jgi:hypothetical protein